ncbi:MAG: ankyrin repeat domain-containing protein [Sphaerochaeta sp.]|nr:ankyrin repeat domain-containing protein [Sphaerochaeta sp.]
MDRSETFARLCVLACDATDGRDLEKLFTKVRDIDDVDEEGKRPLWYAAMDNPSIDVVKTLLAAQARVNFELVQQATIHNPNPEVAMLLFSRLEPVSQEQLNLLFLLAAAANTHDVLVKFYCSKGADPNTTMPMDLYPEPQSDHDDFIDSDEVWWDDDQSVEQNALVVAMYENSEPVEMVRALLDLGVSPNAVDTEGFPVLIHALDNKELVRALVTGGADIDMYDCNGMTALMHACAADNNDVVMSLLELHADVTLKSSNSETALHFALGCHLYENAVVIKALIAAGCDVNQRDGDGLLPLDLARINYCSQEIISILEQAGAVMGDVS